MKRKERREATRVLEKIVRQREALARLSPGGDAGRPIEVESASVVELRAREFTCLRCETAMSVVSHEAEVVRNEVLRTLTLRCPQCGSSRVVWFVVRSHVQ